MPESTSCLPSAGLHDLLRRFDRLHELGAFGDRVRNGLLDVHVLSGGDRIERDRLVPVIRRADDDGVDLPVVQDTAIVGDLQRGGTGDLGGLEQARLVDVTDGRHLVAGQLLQMRHEAARSAAGPDDADADSIVRSLNSGARHPRAERKSGRCDDEGSAVADHL